MHTYMHTYIHKSSVAFNKALRQTDLSTSLNGHKLSAPRCTQHIIDWYSRHKGKTTKLQRDGGLITGAARNVFASSAECNMSDITCDR